MKQEFDAAYWQNRYRSAQTAWDAGTITTPLKEYFDQMTNEGQRTLIPGCGNAYEAEYLFRKGYRHVFLVDVVPEPLANFAARVPEFSKEQLLLQDFFELEGTYDLLVEQTFFCALHPSQRQGYAQKCHELLSDGGKLVGLLFDTTFQHEGPPFGGSRAEYLAYFEPYFKIQYFESAYNSIPPRQGRELFMLLQKK